MNDLQIEHDRLERKYGRSMVARVEIRLGRYKSMADDPFTARLEVMRKMEAEERSPVLVHEGEQFTVWACTHDRDSKVDYTELANSDMKEEDLNEFAESFMWDAKEPEWGFRLDEEQTRRSQD